MSIIKLIAIVSLAVAVLTMVTSNQLSIYASPTTEDDGWVEAMMIVRVKFQVKKN
jgi:hypothetical protein